MSKVALIKGDSRREDVFKSLELIQNSIKEKNIKIKGFFTSLLEQILGIWAMKKMP